MILVYRVREREEERDWDKAGWSRRVRAGERREQGGIQWGPTEWREPGLSLAWVAWQTSRLGTVNCVTR